MRGLGILLSGFAIAYLSLCGVLFFFQRSYIYFPQPRHGAAQTLTLPASGERVLVSTRPLEGPRAMLYFGGNAEDVSLRLPELSSAFPEHALYLLHYRGYGGSSGSPSEKGLFADALALFDEARRKHADIDVVGRSLGSGVAVYLASRRRVARLVLVTPFDSLRDLAAFHYPYLPARWFLLDTYESGEYAPLVSAPTLILAAENDEIVPRASTESLATRFRRGVASLRIVPNTGHDTISGSAEYLRLLQGPP